MSDDRQREAPPDPFVLALALAVREVAARRAAERLERRARLRVVKREEPR